MKKWIVTLLKRADKQLQKLPRSIQDLAYESLEELEAEGPLLKNWDVKKTGNDEYRLRIKYRYRMRYSVKKEKYIIEVFYIGHRKEAYK